MIAASSDRALDRPGVLPPSLAPVSRRVQKATGPRWSIHHCCREALKACQRAFPASVLAIVIGREPREADPLGGPVESAGEVVEGGSAPPAASEPVLQRSRPEPRGGGRLGVGCARRDMGDDEAANLRVILRRPCHLGASGLRVRWVGKSLAGFESFPSSYSAALSETDSQNLFVPKIANRATASPNVEPFRAPRIALARSANRSSPALPRCSQR